MKGFENWRKIESSQTVIHSHPILPADTGVGRGWIISCPFIAGGWPSSGYLLYFSDPLSAAGFDAISLLALILTHA